MANRKGAGAGDGWICPLCTEEIKIGEPFAPILVRAPEPEHTRAVPSHMACHIDAIASETAAKVLDAVADDGDEEPEHRSARGRSGDSLRGALEHHLSQFVADFFRGGD